MASQVFRKLQVHKISSVFRQATKIVEVPLVPPKTDEIRIKNIYAGVNGNVSVQNINTLNTFFYLFLQLLTST